MMGPEFVGMGIGVAIIAAAVKHVMPSKMSKVESCMDSYFADKYNGVSHGSPDKTFVACMKANFSDEFKAISEKYWPKEAPGQA